MDYGRSFTYMFKQPDVWKKILIGGLLLLVPVIGWLWVGGYTLRTLRSVMTGSENLPEWTRWGDLATQGIYVWLGGLIYGLPGAVLGRLGTPGSILSGLWSIVVIVVLPAALMRFAAKGDFGAFFDFNDIFTFINRNLSNYLIVVLLSILAYIIASFGVVLLVIGVLFTSFWGMLVTAHLYGSLARTTGLPLQFGTTR
jgi:hypothetical protein